MSLDFVKQTDHYIFISDKMSNAPFDKKTEVFQLISQTNKDVIYLPSNLWNEKLTKEKLLKLITENKYSVTVLAELYDFDSLGISAGDYDYLVEFQDYWEFLQINSPETQSHFLVSTEVERLDARKKYGYTESRVTFKGYACTKQKFEKIWAEVVEIWQKDEWPSTGYHITKETRSTGFAGTVKIYVYKDKVKVGCQEVDRVIVESMAEWFGLI